MDTFFHFFLALALSGNVIISIGSIIPDLPYWIMIFFQLLKHPQMQSFRSLQTSESFRTSKLWILGEKIHSLVILPVILIPFLYINPFFLYIWVGILLHLAVDLLSHKRYGPRFWWPVSTSFSQMGYFQWDENRKLVVICWGLVFLLLLFNLVFGFLWSYNF